MKARMTAAEKGHRAEARRYGGGVRGQIRRVLAHQAEADRTPPAGHAAYWQERADRAEQVLVTTARKAWRAALEAEHTREMQLARLAPVAYEQPEDLLPATGSVNGSVNVLARVEAAMRCDYENSADQSARLIGYYQQATAAERAVVDNVFIALCGWSLDSIVAGRDENEDE